MVRRMGIVAVEAGTLLGRRMERALPGKGRKLVAIETNPLVGRSRRRRIGVAKLAVEIRMDRGTQQVLAPAGMRRMTSGALPLDRDALVEA